MPSPQEDAKTVRDAMKGLGTDDKVLIETIAARSCEDLQHMRAAFHSEFGRDLVNDIKSECSGDYERAIVGLVYTRAEFDAHACNKAMKGMGTKESTLIETLVHRTFEEREAIKAAYLQMYGKTLEHDIAGDMGGDMEKLFLSMINVRPVDFQMDANFLLQVADDLHKKGAGTLGTDEKGFIAILTTCSNQFLKALNYTYAMKYGDSLETAIGQEMGGNLAKTMSVIMSDHDEYYASLIDKACDGAGTNDDLLIRTIIGRRHRLRNISEQFVHRFGKSIHSRISSEVSGDYGKVLKKVTEGF